MTEVVLGEPIRLRVEFRDPVSGALTDPTTVTAGALKPDGSAATVGTPAKESTGIWYADIASAEVDTAGVWTWYMAGTGGIEARFEDEILVATSPYSPPRSWLKESEYESIRRQLGVTRLDVNDDMIADLAYGGAAELRLADDMGGSAAVDAAYADAGLKPRVQLALVYATAAILAEFNVKGGWLSQVTNEQQRGPKADPQRLWGLYGEQLRLLLASGDPDAGLARVSMTSIIVTGPTRADAEDSSVVRWGGFLPPSSG